MSALGLTFLLIFTVGEGGGALRDLGLLPGAGGGRYARARTRAGASTRPRAS